MRVAAITDIGLCRQRNEDNYFIDADRHIFVICDGMGGHKGGNVASQLAVETMQKQLFFASPEDIIPALRNAFQHANQVIYEKGQSDPSLLEMGTTMTAAVLTKNYMVVAHVGDSSLFLYTRDGQFKKITRDHTLSQQILADSLPVNQDFQIKSYNHILTRAVGVEAEVEVDIMQEEITAGDWILMCTDGLTDLVGENEIYEHLQAAREPQLTAQALLDTAMGRGGHDNITIVVLSV